MMTKKEKAMVADLEKRYEAASKKAAVIDALVAVIMDDIERDVRQIAEEEAGIAVDDLQISR